MFFQALCLQIRLNLVYRRADFVIVYEVYQPVSIEVRHSDRAQYALLVERLKVAPGRINVAIRPVKEHQVDVVRPEFCQ